MKTFKAFFLPFASASLLGVLTGVSKAEHVNYTLLNGDSISGKLIEKDSSNDLKVIDHKYLGRIKVKSSSIFYPKTKKWSGNLEVGLDGSSTTSSNSLGYLLEANTKYRDLVKEISLGTRYDFKKTSESGKESITEVNKALTRVRYDLSIGDAWTSYFSTNYEYNGINKIGVNDIKSSAGLSYKVLDSAKAILRLSTGPSLQWIDGGSDCHKESSCGKTQPGAFFGTDFKWSINSKLKLLLENTYNTQLTGNSLISNRFISSIRFFPSQKSNLYTSLSYENIYDQIKEPSQEHIYRLKVGTKF